MKNVFQRCLALIILFEKDIGNLDADYIKDNMPQYRDLNQSAFHRSFERDKEVLRSIGFVIKYSNDKWELESKYEFSGINIWNNIKSQKSEDSFDFLTTFLYLKDVISLNENQQVIKNNQNFALIQSAIDKKLRISFRYNDKKRIVFPYGFKLYKDIWYLCALDDETPKTYTIERISYIKLGDKSHNRNLDIQSLPSSFSWDNQTDKIHLKLVIDKKAYFVHKNIFIHKLINSKENEDFLTLDIETFDSYGLKIFMILNDQYCKKINILTKDFKKELISEFSK